MVQIFLPNLLTKSNVLEGFSAVFSAVQALSHAFATPIQITEKKGEYKTISDSAGTRWNR
jgi:hypothetical protein